MKIFYVTVDHFDGSNGVEWWREEDSLILQRKLDDDEAYYGNEGGAAFLTLPDDFDLAAAGIRLRGKSL